MPNLTPTLLDSPQIVKRIYDETDDAIRIKIASGVDFAVELNADDGDSVESRGISGSTKVSLTSASTGVVVAAFDCKGMKSFNLYTKTTSTIVGAQACTFEVSPSDVDDVWVATTLTVTPSTVNGTVVMGTANSNIVPRRGRVSIAAAITSGTFDLYIVRSGV